MVIKLRIDELTFTKITIGITEIGFSIVEIYMEKSILFVPLTVPQKEKSSINYLFTRLTFQKSDPGTSARDYCKNPLAPS